jgi:uncharacterized protein (TIGR02145 family)
MKKIMSSLLILSVGIIMSNTFALTYTINFSGSGLSSTVDSVVVQNLTKKTTTVVSTGMDLFLTDITTETMNIHNSNSEISVCSTAVNGKLALKFYAKESGWSKIYLIGVDGKIIKEYSDNLQTGDNSFDISAPRGVYVIHVVGSNYNYSKKFVIQSSTGENAKITFRNLVYRSPVLKSKTNSFVTMSYSSGDQLIYSGKSGNYCTLVSDVPIASKSITFEFHECKDLSGKYYAVTKIGTQVWMAENLAYLPVAATADPTIGSEDAGNSGKAFCYVNDIAKYGVLYNWFAAQAAVPDGWHLPSNTEWSLLSTYLGGNSVAGQKLKSTTNWNNSNTGTNASGFSAPGGGKRDTGGIAFSGSYGYWWSATPNGPYAWFVMIGNGSNGISTYNDYTYLGQSVRCVMNY